MACFISTFANGGDYGDLRELIRYSSKTHFSTPYYEKRAEWLERRAALREKILVAAGLWPLEERPPVQARRFERSVKGRYAVEKVQIESLPGFLVGGNLYLPLNRQGPRPAVLVAHGHWKHGRLHDAQDYSVPALCANLAARGFVVFAWDMVGYNDNRQLPHDFGGSPEEQAWAFTPLGLQLWNSIRALDFLEQIPEVDPRRIGMTGTSGGGTQTYLLAAVDERIRAAAPAGMVSSIFQGDDACEMAPGLRTGTSNVEITAMIAPRPLLLVAATGDWTRNTMNEELPSIRSIYALYGQSRGVSATLINAGHNCNRESREAIYSFFRRTLGRRSDDRSVPEAKDLPLPTHAELLIGCEYEQREKSKEVFAAWKQMSAARTARMGVNALSGRLATVLGIRWPERVSALPMGDRFLLSRQDSGERVPAVWLNPPGEKTTSVTLDIVPEGLRCEYCRAAAHESGASGDARLLVEVFHSSRPPVRSYDLERLTFHRSEDAERAQDILTAAAYAARFAGGAPIRLSCSGNARAWCLLAAAAAPSSVQFNFGESLLSLKEDELYRTLAVPGLQWAGGIHALRASAAAHLPIPESEAMVTGGSPLQ